MNESGSSAKAGAFFSKTPCPMKFSVQPSVKEPAEIAHRGRKGLKASRPAAPPRTKGIPSWCRSRFMPSWWVAS